MRLFVALEVPSDVRDRVAAAVAHLHDRHSHLRWSAPSTWHLTLAFVGEVDEHAERRVHQALQQAAAGSVAVEVAFGRAGRFGRGVLWLGLTDAAYAAVVDLGGRVRDALSAHDVPFDSKPLHPHLTLARARRDHPRAVSRDRVAEVDQAMAQVAGRLAWRATEVSLVSSTLGRGGAQHARVATVHLGR